jgi:hypothetical protein
VASQSRTSRAAARAVRIIRLIRLLRIVKLYKSAVLANETKENIKRQRLKIKKNKLSSERVQTRAQVNQLGPSDTPEIKETAQYSRMDSKASPEPNADAAIA